MSVETNLNAAAYFEDRARRTCRNAAERERLLTVAKRYRERAKAQHAAADDRAKSSGDKGVNRPVGRPLALRGWAAPSSLC
jgi:hypothetical protein